MKFPEFVTLCEKHLISPYVALENEELKQIIRDGATAQTVENFLINNF